MGCKQSIVLHTTGTKDYSSERMIAEFKLSLGDQKQRPKIIDTTPRSETSCSSNNFGTVHGISSIASLSYAETEGNTDGRSSTESCHSNITYVIAQTAVGNQLQRPNCGHDSLRPNENAHRTMQVPNYRIVSTGLDESDIDTVGFQDMKNEGVRPETEKQKTSVDPLELGFEDKKRPLVRPMAAKGPRSHPTEKSIRGCPVELMEFMLPGEASENKNDKIHKGVSAKEDEGLVDFMLSQKRKAT